MWKHDSQTARHDLSELFRRALLLWDNETRRYRQHDLFRVIALNRIGKAALDAAHLNHARYFVGLLRQANKDYHSGGSRMMAGLTQYDQDAHNIIAVMAWATRAMNHNQGARTIVNELPDAGVGILGLRMPPQCRIAWLTQAVKAAQILRHGRAEMIHVGNLGLAYRQIGNFKKALHCQEQKLAFARKENNLYHEAASLINIGNIYTNLKKYKKAFEYCQQGLELSRLIDDEKRQLERYALGSLATALAYLREPVAKVLECHQQQLEICQAPGVKDLFGASVALWNIADLCGVRGLYDDAIELAERSLVIKETIGDPFVAHVREKLATWRAASAQGRTSGREKS